MTVRLSIRSYSLVMRAHHHVYHQLVIPLHGSITLTLPDFSGKVGPGQCVVIGAERMHEFKADEKCRFLVADLDHLPESMRLLAQPVFATSPELVAYCHFLELQLTQSTRPDLIASMSALFYQLLQSQIVPVCRDGRIREAVRFLNEDISRTPSLRELAALSCLSLSQFKLLFKQHMGMTAGQYLLTQRMIKAKALLAHSDLPVSLIAERVGFTDVSAFSRRFSSYWEETPRQIRRR
ncbi:AraC family transcriptional regulator [Photobacterium sp. TLY01]|uniref:AraC family transcriptional regulator n=1 Tax=Photobacterium sp. TLY01 TaxID=2907534 RepID=UPI001F41336B|nr:AraC family transcriptional regulator [Photobacterium sp. TLY01]UIP29679.1 AraC family transcriptional regulator [Photobacterium sp. TLY01]